MTVTSVRPAPLISHENNRTVVWLDGECDLATLPRASRHPGPIGLRRTAADIVVDLSGVTFIGAESIGELIRTRNLLGGQARVLTLRLPSRCPRRILQVCGLDALIEAG